MSRIIPTYEKGVWTTTEFENDLDFREYLELIFKEPGLYNFDETALLFNAVSYTHLTLPTKA